MLEEWIDEQMRPFAESGGTAQTSMADVGFCPQIYNVGLTETHRPTAPSSRPRARARAAAAGAGRRGAATARRRKLKGPRGEAGVSGLELPERRTRVSRRAPPCAEPSAPRGAHAHAAHAHAAYARGAPAASSGP